MGYNSFAAIDTLVCISYVYLYVCISYFPFLLSCQQFVSVLFYFSLLCSAPESCPVTNGVTTDRMHCGDELTSEHQQPMVLLVLQIGVNDTASEPKPQASTQTLKLKKVLRTTAVRSVLVHLLCCMNTTRYMSYHIIYRKLSSYRVYMMSYYRVCTSSILVSYCCVPSTKATFVLVFFRATTRAVYVSTILFFSFGL